MVVRMPAPPPETAYADKVRELVHARLNDSPDWLADLRLRALCRFEALGFPTRRLEAWKYINVRPLLSMPLAADTAALAAPVNAKVCPPALKVHLLNDAGGDVIRLVFINGHFSLACSSVPDRMEGDAIVSSMKASLLAHPGRVRSAFESLLNGVSDEPDAMATLNMALFEDGVFIDIPADTKVKPLIQLIFAQFGEASRTTQPRNLIRLGKNARVNMVVEHLGLSEAVSFNNSVNTFTLDEGARADCTMILGEGPRGWHLANTQSHLAASSKLNLYTVTLSGLVNRHSIRTLLQGEHAEAHHMDLDVLEHKTEIYHHTVTEHWAQNGISRQLCKSILDDEAKSEFNSIVFVAKGAIGTDSQQLNKNLLLSENARVWTRPQLQINADDVKCAHGAATGQLDEAQLFYLASRGLDKKLAQSLLTYGFAEDVIRNVPDARMREYLDRRVLANLHDTDVALLDHLGS